MKVPFMHNNKLILLMNAQTHPLSASLSCDTAESGRQMKQRGLPMNGRGGGVCTLPFSARSLIACQQHSLIKTLAATVARKKENIVVLILDELKHELCPRIRLPSDTESIMVRLLRGPHTLEGEDNSDHMTR